METKGKKQSFFMKNIYYFVIAFVLLAAIAVTVVLVLTGNSGTVGIIDKPGGQTERPNGNDSSGGNVNPDDGKKDDKSNTEDPDAKPTVKITFVMPVENSTVLTDYTATSVVYNKTLNVYTGHLAIDFSAAKGAPVKAVYDGVVESVETSYLTGTTVTIVHNDKLKTVYNSIDADEKLVAGTKITQGQTIGTVSDNNKQEYKDGPHLHFEVYEEGKKISPYKYLSVQEK